jgi:hypothetical protein
LKGNVRERDKLGQKTSGTIRSKEKTKSLTKILNVKYDSGKACHYFLNSYIMPFQHSQMKWKDHE